MWAVVQSVLLLCCAAAAVWLSVSICSAYDRTLTLLLCAQI